MKPTLAQATFFTQKPTPEQMHKLDSISVDCVTLWQRLDLILPDGPYKTMAFRHLEDLCTDAKKAVCLNTDGVSLVSTV